MSVMSVMKPARHRNVVVLAGGIGLGAWAAFAVLCLVVDGRGTPLPVDDALLSWSLGHRPEVAVAVARGLTATGTDAFPYLLVVLAGLVVGRTARQRMAAAALGLVCLVAGQAARHGVLELVARSRPPRQEWLTHASNWSFPSGHATTSALVAGLVILAMVVRAPHGRTAICLVVGCWGALVGLTRVYLGVHWFTDVVGGWLFAVGWLGVCLGAAARWLPVRLVAGPGPKRPDDREAVAGKESAGRPREDSHGSGGSRREGARGARHGGRRAEARPPEAHRAEAQRTEDAEARPTQAP
ncbi:phosphatase PAP2 family protein [Streptomyces thermoalcalitolerans]|uniref:Phosphatase PAP2 family protein n=1 Tax=Streptomyces thermoalcalitolerans TaxID=65605 RepID=A0ABN1P0I7_9ACTN